MPLLCEETEYETEDFGEQFECSDCGGVLHYDHLDDDASDATGKLICVYCTGRND